MGAEVTRENGLGKEDILPELEKQLLGRVIAGERKVLGLFVTERPLFSQNSSHIQVVTIYELGAYLEAIQSNAGRLVPQ